MATERIEDRKFTRFISHDMGEKRMSQSCVSIKSYRIKRHICLWFSILCMVSYLTCLPAILVFAYIFISPRQTIAEATDTVDRLLALVKPFYKNNVSRVWRPCRMGVMLSVISGIKVSWSSHLKIWPSVGIAIGVLLLFSYNCG